MFALLLIEENFSKKYEYRYRSDCIKTFAFARDCLRENTLKKILFYRDSLNANFSETLP